MYADVAAGEGNQNRHYPCPARLFGETAVERPCRGEAAACVAGWEGPRACIGKMGGEHHRKTLYLRERTGPRHKIFQDKVVENKRSCDAKQNLNSMAAGLFADKQDYGDDQPYKTKVAEN